MKQLQGCPSNFGILCLSTTVIHVLFFLWFAVFMTFFCYRRWLHYNHFQILPLTRINQPMLSSGLLWPDCCQYQSLFKSSWGISALLCRYRRLTFHYESFMLASSTWLNWNLFNVLNAAESTIVEIRLSSVYLLLAWQVLLACTVNYCLTLFQQPLLEHFSSGRASSSSSSLRLLFVLLLVPYVVE